MTNIGYAGNTGSAYGQGAVATTNAALSGVLRLQRSWIRPAHGNAMGAAGQFTTDGSGNITGGVMDLNDSGNSGA